MRAVSRRTTGIERPLADPTNVYQLSLRLGLDFEATCLALADRKANLERRAQAALRERR